MISSGSRDNREDNAIPPLLKDKDSAYKIGTSPRKQNRINMRFNAASPAFFLTFFLFISYSSLIPRFTNREMMMINTKMIMETAEDSP